MVAREVGSLWMRTELSYHSRTSTGGSTRVRRNITLRRGQIYWHAPLWTRPFPAIAGCQPCSALTHPRVLQCTHRDVAIRRLQS